MIELTCTKCKAQLMLDDAFAGGVCRCQHCGTIQTVPSHMRQSAPMSVAGQPKALYQGPQPLPAGTGLDELAEVVASSGLSSGRLRTVQTMTAPPPRDKRLRIVLLAVGATVVLGVATAALLFLKPARTDDGGYNKWRQDAGANWDKTPPPKQANPSFMGLPVEGPCVVYLLDRGQGTREYFDYMKTATTMSLNSLKGSIKLQVIFWDNHTPPADFPKSGPAALSPASLKEIQQGLDDTPPDRQSDVTEALKRAIGGAPSDIFLVTNKDADTLGGEAFLGKVMGIRGSSKVRIHTFALGTKDDVEPLKKVAESTGGKFHPVPMAHLKSFAE